MVTAPKKSQIVTINLMADRCQVATAAIGVVGILRIKSLAFAVGDHGLLTVGDDDHGASYLLM